MHERFNRVFRDLYDSFVALDDFRRAAWPWMRPPWRSEPLDANMALLVRDSIERAIGRLGIQDRLRWDARYFLLVNFSHMIAEPLATDPERQTNLEKLARDIEADAETVLRTATQATMAGADPGTKVSGGDILQAVATNYREMKVSRYRVWN